MKKRLILYYQNGLFGVNLCFKCYDDIFLVKILRLEKKKKNHRYCTWQPEIRKEITPNHRYCTWQPEIRKNNPKSQILYMAA